ncbi:MAG: hypothetical protein MZU97_22005 [Bacillus subtilis]|nr:hypothetical protein [Bacillus subtilis]
MERKKRYVFREIEDTREQLEIIHLRTKNHFVLAFLFVLLGLSIAYLAFSKAETSDLWYVGIGFGVIILMNFAALAYGGYDPRFYQLNKHTTTFGIYTVILLVIFTTRSPGMFPALFLAYAISAFYQDLKVMIVSDILLAFSIITLMVNYPAVLNFPQGAAEDNIGLGFFVFVFLSLLTIASFIIIKQKRFFYNQIALAKETEFRNIDLLIDLKEKAGIPSVDTAAYYQRVRSLTAAFAKKIEIENGFLKRVDLLEALEKKTPISQILSSHPETTKEELSRLEDLLLSNHHKLMKLAIKLSQVQKIHIKRREIFSETQFKSFNHQSDNLEIKIIAFAIFYATLKHGNAFFRPLTEQEIRHVLIETDYYYYNDPRIMRIYRENSSVFEDIVADIFGKECRV